MAHIVASITVFVNAPPLYLREGTPLQTQRIAPDTLFLFAAEIAASRSCFSGIFCTPNKDLYLIRNKVDYW